MFSKRRVAANFAVCVLPLETGGLRIVCKDIKRAARHRCNIGAAPTPTSHLKHISDAGSYLPSGCITLDLVGFLHEALRAPRTRNEIQCIRLDCEISAADR
jgi:hypothetical protein